MARYIDADALMELVGRERLDTRERIANLIERQPTADVVEVVRCKDCKHGSQYTNDKVWCSLGATSYRPNDYCSYGERREE